MSFLCHTGQSKPYTMVEGGPAEAIEYLAAKAKEENNKENVLRFATFGITPERTAILLNLPLEKVKSILEGKL